MDCSWFDLALKGLILTSVAKSTREPEQLHSQLCEVHESNRYNVAHACESKDVGHLSKGEHWVTLSVPSVLTRILMCVCVCVCMPRTLYDCVYVFMPKLCLYCVRTGRHSYASWLKPIVSLPAALGHKSTHAYK